MPLNVGVEHAKELVRKSSKPMIPIHHMEAHALTARMLERIDFPFLVFLVSGGHCLLAVAKSVDQFLLLGRGIDGSPGEAFDKTARSLRLKNLPQCEGLSGGASVELMAKNGNPHAFEFPTQQRSRKCDFSMSGLKEFARQIIEKEERRQGLLAGDVLSNAADICASFQFGLLQHFIKKLQRAFLFCELKNLLPEQNRVLVMSGGVASNSYLKQNLEKVCNIYNCRMVCPPPRLCTDNGAMIAWLVTSRESL
ncbi:hypothetical protein KUTeg_008910 [Tegillarca granosa]|nr:hypothetical protein KUTeg_008910 [Tegillarca granosa]